MKLSVIIPAYNDLQAVLQCLNSLQATADAPHEYIVQDDCSPDVHYPAFISPNVAQVERNPHNRGFAGNCNAGAKRATGDILFFVNQDVYAVYTLSNRWDSELLKAFHNPLVGVMGCKLVFPNGAIQHAGMLHDGHGQPFHRFLGYQNANYIPANQPEEVSAVTGAALAIRRNLFEQLGGFDEAFIGGYFEDVDLCAKVAVAGKAIWYQPTVQLVHMVGTSGGNPHFMHNAKLFKERWVDPGYITPDVPVVKEGWW